ncbi:hypothetical protein K502DRAFT_367225 [Neoconidiobolus thromboides FSU 785]|nr:hypothetical protein K502DRAFT_367225 [Neoconidiobolus thromboides FSU 785]
MVSSLVILLGSISLCLSFLYITLKQDIWLIFNWHPLLMTLYFTFHTYAISRLQKPKNKANKERSVILHQLFHLISVVLQLLGFIAVYYHKFHRGAQHFTSWHGFLGLVVILSTFPVIAFGSFSIYFPNVLDKPMIKKAIYFHRMFGYLLYLLLCITYITGLQSSWLERIIGPHAWMFVLLALSILSLLYRVNIKKLI